MSAKATGKDSPEYRLSEALKDFNPPTTFDAIGMLLCLPLAAASLLFMLMKEFVKSPIGFFRRQDRSPDQLAMPASLEGLKHEHIEVAPGVKLHIATFGRRPDKPLMLFLHGFPECWYSWRDQLAAYRADYEVVAADMRGYNTSSKPKGISSYTMDRLTADVAALVRALGRSSCTLVAHDWGGAVAWAVAGRYPGLVDRLAVLAAPQFYLYRRNLVAEQAARSYYFLWFLLPFLPEAFLLSNDCGFIASIWLAAAAYSPRRRGAATAADVEVYKAALQQPGAATAALNYYRAAVLGLMGLMPQHPEVDAGMRRQLDMPVLVVWGKEDHALCLSNMRDVDKLAPLAQVHVLPGCSHWIQADQPAALRRILDNWLAANPLKEGAAAAGTGAAASSAASGR